MGKKKAVELHDFYCIKCGNKGISLMRTKGFQHETHHRKKLYCLYCKKIINHIECKSFEEVQEFKKKFEEGEFIDEAENSISYVRAECEWEKYLDSRKNE